MEREAFTEVLERAMALIGALALLPDGLYGAWTTSYSGFVVDERLLFFWVD